MTEDRRAALVAKVDHLIQGGFLDGEYTLKNLLSAALDLALEEAAREAEQTNTALLRDGSFFSERVAAAPNPNLWEEIRCGAASSRRPGPRGCPCGPSSRRPARGGG